MKKISLVLLTLAMMLGMFTTAWADTVVVGTGTSVARWPLGAYFGYERSAALYTSAEIAASGNISISALAWYATIARTANIPMVIYLKSTTSTTLTAGTWASMISGATTVLTTTNASITANAWNTFNLGTSFPLNSGENLLVLVECNFGGGGSGGSGGTGVRYSTAASRHETWATDSTPPSTNGTVGSSRPNVTITYSAAGGVNNPTAFTATAVSDRAIDLSWARNATPDNVMIARNTTNTFGTPSGSYIVDDFITGGGQVIYNGSGTSHNDTSLSANTPYYYKAWSVNGGTPTYSAGVTASARTFLRPIADFPWTETFEDASETRAGWTQVYELGVGDWTYALGSNGEITAAYDGVLNARYVSASPSGGGTPVTKLVSPIMDLSSAPGYVLSFWYGQPDWAGDQNTTKVYYRTSSSSSWVEIANYTADVSVWTQEPGLVLPNPSATYQIAFEGINNYGYANVIDQVIVDAAALDPVFAVSPANKDFGDQQIEASSAPQVFTIKNNGGGTLRINSVTKGGTNASEFDLTDTNGYYVDLDAGESITVSVVFSPDTIGAKSAKLTISHDQAGSPVDVALTGTGTDTTIRELPYIQRWDVTAIVEGWVLYNVNADGVVWGLSLDGTDNAAVIGYNSSLAMDDWLISPPIVMEGGTTYEVTYDYRCASATYPENLAFAFGTAQNPTAMTEEIADHFEFVNTTYLPGTATFTPSTSGNYYLGLHGYSAADMYNIYVDDIRILIPNSQIAEVTSTGTTATVAVPEIEINGVPTATQVDFDGIATGQVCTVWAEFEPEDVTLPNTGLVLTIEGGDLSGIPLTLTHNIGFVPDQVNYKIGDGSYLAVENPGGWTETTITLTPPATKSASRLKIVFPKDRDDETPVELSSFTATLTVDNYVNLAWTTQSETGVQGYYIYRGSSDILEDALLVSPLIDATNTSEQQTYTFQDTELLENGTYYYWLSNADYNGIVGFHGPISVVYSPEGGTTPPIPVVTALGNVYPNPFNPVAYIPFSLAESSAVKIDIFNARGQLIRSINVGERVPGNYKIDWNGKDSSGDNCGTGIYYFRMTTNHDTFTRKAVLMK